MEIEWQENGMQQMLPEVRSEWDVKTYQWHYILKI